MRLQPSERSPSQRTCQQVRERVRPATDDHACAQRVARQSVAKPQRRRCHGAAASDATHLVPACAVPQHPPQWRRGRAREALIARASAGVAVAALPP